jgi:hypothetical protein
VPINLRIVETDSKLSAIRETVLAREIAITTTSDHLLLIVDSNTPARKSMILYINNWAALLFDL